MTDKPADRARWQRVEELFHQALELEGSRAERVAAVRSWTGADTALADEVLSLVDSLNAVEEVRRADPPQSAADAWLGRVVGGYRIVRELGRGGMGVVYAAERVAGAGDLVALKVVGTRLRSRLLIERFEQERRALAAVRHAHIAHLLDGGVSQSGEPYFVMELIEGERLDSYCQSRDLSRDAILELMEQLCYAVGFAHTHRILHGDLKPSNVMVTSEGELKLVDFGAAMLLPSEGGANDDATPLAAFTPEYASPERIAGRQCAAASDIYSLGAMLYRLLTGRAPVRGHTRTTLATDAESIVPQLTAADAQQPAEEAERADILKDDALDADLSAMIACAMEADPEKRYASAADMAADLRRYWEHRPVEARAASLAEVVARFARRNRRSLALVLLLVGALGAGAVLAVRQTRVARAEEQRSRRAMADVRQLAAFLSTDFYDHLADVSGSVETQRRVTVQALQYLDGMRKDAAGDFDFDIDLATAYIRVGSVQGDPYQPNLGDAKGARQTLERGRETAAEALRMRPRDLRAMRTATLAEQTMSEILFGDGDAAAALPYAQKAAELGEQLIASSGATPRDLSNVAGIYSVLGDQYGLPGEDSLGDQPKAIVAYRRFIALNQEVLKRESGNLRTVRALAVGYQKIGNLLVEQDPVAARPLFLAALEQLGRVPNLPPLMQRQIPMLHVKLGDCFYYEGNYRASLAELKLAESLYMPLAAKDPGNMRVLQSEASIYRDQGESYEALSDWAHARTAYQKVADVLVTALRKDADNHMWQAHASENLVSLATAERHLTMMAAADGHERQGIAMAIKLAEGNDPSPDDLDAAARHLLMAEPASLRQPQQALVYAQRANQMVHESDPDYLLTLAQAQAGTGNPQAALLTAQKLLGMRPNKIARRDAEALLARLNAEKHN
jgi:non-specific serine/threonine protein kinase/serine/threonine-protein kinase